MKLNNAEKGCIITVFLSILNQDFYLDMNLDCIVANLDSNQD